MTTTNQKSRQRNALHFILFSGLFICHLASAHVRFSKNQVMAKHCLRMVYVCTGSVSCPQPTSHHHFRISYNLDDVELLKEGVRRFGIFLMALQTAAEDADGFRAAVKA